MDLETLKGIGILGGAALSVILVVVRVLDWRKSKAGGDPVTHAQMTDLIRTTQGKLYERCDGLGERVTATETRVSIQEADVRRLNQADRDRERELGGVQERMRSIDDKMDRLLRLAEKSAEKAA